MSLPKSPKRTPALLAANRATAPKCIGLRSEAGKARTAWNATTSGRRAKPSEACSSNLPRYDQSRNVYEKRRL